MSEEVIPDIRKDLLLGLSWMGLPLLFLSLAPGSWPEGLNWLLCLGSLPLISLLSYVFDRLFPPSRCLEALWMLPLLWPLTLLILLWPDTLTRWLWLLPWGFFLRRRGLHGLALQSCLLFLCLIVFRVESPYPLQARPDLYRLIPDAVYFIPVIPLGFCISKSTRRIARWLTVIAVTALLLCVSLLPLTWVVATSFQEAGQAERELYSMIPEPRYVLLEIPAPAEGELSDEALQLLAGVLERLQAPELAELLKSDLAEPEEMLRLYKMHGFLQQDRYGLHVAAASWRQPPATMGERFLPELEALRHYASFSPQSLGVDPESAAWRELLRAGYFTGIPEVPGRFRLTPQARHELRGPFVARQIDWLLDGLTADTRQEVAGRTGLPLEQAGRELQALQEAGYLDVRIWNPERIVASWRHPLMLLLLPLLCLILVQLFLSSDKLNQLLFLSLVSLPNLLLLLAAPGMAYSQLCALLIPFWCLCLLGLGLFYAKQHSS